MSVKQITKKVHRTTQTGVSDNPDETTVVAFRVSKKAMAAFEKRMNKRPVVGIRSIHQYARKLFLDFTNNKCVYLNPVDAAEDPAT
jgi:hypothetical protein